MIHTSKEKLRKIFKEASETRIEEFYQIFKANADLFSITSEVQENFFLAQIVAETGYNLIPKRESLWYSVEVLKVSFRRYKNNPKWAARDGYIKNSRGNYTQRPNQVNIGNIAYADRIGNGDIASGDGYNFRGGGYFQLTGKGNYERMSEVIQRVTGDPIGPEGLVKEINTVTISLLTALAFWLDNRCYACTNIDCVTEKINKYTNTYEKRKKIYQWIATL